LSAIREKHDKLLFAFFKGAAIAQIHVTAHSNAAPKRKLGNPEDEV